MVTQTLKLKCQDELKGLTKEYWENVVNAPQAGKMVAWSSVMGPTDLLTAMGFTVAFPENYGATCGAKRVSTEFCERAEAHDYSPDICSYARNGIGATLSDNVKELCPVGGFPKPDLLVATSYCTPIIKWFEVVAQMYDVPMILLDFPFIHDGASKDDKDRAVAYMRGQIDDEILFLEKFTGRRFDYDGLQQSLSVTAQMHQLWEETLKLSRNIPAPISCFDLFVQLFPITCMRGDPRGVAYYEKFKAEVTERVEQGVGAIPNEKYRLYWDNLPIWFKMRDLSMEFASYDANVVTALYPFIWALPLDTTSPLDSIASSLTLGINNSGVKQRADFITNLVRDYSIDGMVMQMSRSCKLMCLGQFDTIEQVDQQLGVPGVILEADMCDARQYSEAQVKLRIQAFMELLASRKK